MYSRGPVGHLLMQRASDELDWSYAKKNCLSKRICFLRFVLAELLKWKTWIGMWFGRSKDYFFPVVNNEVNCASDKLVETTKTSLPCSPAVDQSVSWISRSNSVRLRILLSSIPCTVNKSPPNYQFGVLDTKSLIRLIRLVVCILTHPTGSSKYGTTRKNTQRYYTTKRLIRYMLAPGPLISLDQLRVKSGVTVSEGKLDVYMPVKSLKIRRRFRRRYQCLV